MLSRHSQYMLIVLFCALLCLSVGPAEENQAVRLVATGDTMLGSWVGDVIKENGYDYPFKFVSSYTNDADIYFTNLEAPFGTSGQPFEKRFTFRVHPKLVNVLLSGKINLVSLANNHTMDYGVECLRETFQVLDEHQIAYAGAGLDLTEARKAAVVEKNGRKVALLSYSLTFPEEFWATDTSAGTCFPYETFAYKDVSKLKRENDFVIVSCHWGAELRDTPKPYQIELARKFIDSGADLVLGHHPHVVQGIEFYKGKLIAYSLGNYIFGSYSERVKDSMILKVDLDNGPIGSVDVLPISVYNKEVDFQPVPLEGARKSAFFKHLIGISKELNSDSLGISSEGIVRIAKAG